MSISNNLQAIRHSLPPHVRLCAVSKTHPAETVMEAYRAGQRLFGENKVQELMAKAQTLPEDIEWHFIGYLQTNKVRQAVKYASVIQSVDRPELIAEIENEARKQKKKIDLLLEFRIASEETKHGLLWEDCLQLLELEEFRNARHINIRGVMGMASFTSDEAMVRAEFHRLKEFFDRLKEEFFSGKEDFSEISMGMSDDYPIAIEEGSTLVRIGTAVFGQRNQGGQIPAPVNFF